MSVHTDEWMLLVSNTQLGSCTLFTCPTAANSSSVHLDLAVAVQFVSDLEQQQHLPEHWHPNEHVNNKWGKKMRKIIYLKTSKYKMCLIIVA